MSGPVSSTFSSLRQRIAAVGLRDERRLSRKVDQARSQRDHARRQRLLESLDRDLAKAEQRIDRRRAQDPRILFPDELPVSARHAEIAETIEQNQVVIVAGETGSGKTTQLPKIVLSLGRGVRGTIGHTQPRRIAARTVAERISEECDVDLGTSVGYTVRFHDQTSEETLIKVMTDGILLAEIRGDPQLLRYDTIIIDEAHERSLSIDFLLGYLKRLLPHRPDLKLIITSATIDPDRFAELFEGAPIVEVSGRTYPVEVRYRPVAEREDGDTLQAISEAVDELATAGRGDVLVFLSGEREIRDAAELLNQRKLRNTEILPLYGRLSSAEQHRVFEAHTGRRIVLATNVAETSLTVPGIKYVIDPGTARISRYSQRLKVQRLPIEAISQASANQRAGRCGRTSDGICIRLYSEEDFESRPEFTDPEILRTNLASVILQMTALDLGSVADFPFLDAPDRRAVRDGVDLLLELGALQQDDSEGNQRLTPTGRTLSGLPLDPRLARMLVEASKNGCLRDVLIIVSGLSIQDPRERPSDQQQAADTLHARFADGDSDFASYLNLWRYLREQRRELSGSGFRRMCRNEFLHFMRIREWQDVHGLLRQTAQELGLEQGSSTDSVDSDRIHQSLLAGLLSHIGLNDGGGREYVGARQARFAIFPGSSLAKKPPHWIMAGELVETSRLWARTVARVDPAWIEEQAAHLVKRHYSEPHWSRKRGAVMARERVTLYGVPLVADRLVSYGRINPEVARELFIRHGLVEGDWDTRHRFFHRNRELLSDVENLEDRVRRRDIRVDDEEVFDFYDARVGAEVVSGRHFDTWWKRTRRDQPDLLDFDLDLLVREGAARASTEAYPQEWRSGDFELALSYVFEPGTERDGITIDVPLGGLSQLDPSAFLWHVPGHRHELVTALIKTLPRTWRKQFAPAADFARRVLDQADGESGALVPTVAVELRRMTGVVVPEDAFAPDNVPDHLRLTFRVVDGEREVAVGKDLDALREQLRPQTRTVLSKASHGIERCGATAWEFDDIPREITSTVHGHTVTAYPTLADRGTSVDLTVVESAGQQQVDMAQGLRRLLILAITSPVSPLLSAVPNQDKLMLATSPYDSVLSLVEDCVAAAVDHLMHGGIVWRAVDFEILRQKVRADLYGAAEDAIARVVQALRASGDLRQQMRTAPAALAGVVDDVAVQLSWLIYPGFVSDAGFEPLVHYPRYLKAAAQRLAPGNDQAVDTRNMLLARDLEARFYTLIETMPDYRSAMPDVRAARWSLEELRVGLFAQRLRTARPVSVKRVAKQLDELERAALRMECPPASPGSARATGT